MDHDRAAFWVESIHLLVEVDGEPERTRVPTSCSITADAGGSNGARVRRRKVELQELADELRAADLRLSLSAGHEQMEQDRAPPLFLHQSELARQSPSSRMKSSSSLVPPLPQRQSFACARAWTPNPIPPASRSAGTPSTHSGFARRRFMGTGTRPSSRSPKRTCASRSDENDNSAGAGEGRTTTLCARARVPEQVLLDHDTRSNRKWRAECPERRHLVLPQGQGREDFLWFMSSDFFLTLAQLLPRHPSTTQTACV